MAPTSPGTAIRRARERKRWKQQDLARAVGVSTRTVSEWENDKASPRSSTGALEEVLGISLSGGEAEQPPLHEIVRANYGDPVVSGIWSRDHISRDARLGLIAWYVSLRDASHDGSEG